MLVRKGGGRHLYKFCILDSTVYLCSTDNDPTSVPSHVQHLHDFHCTLLEYLRELQQTPERTWNPHWTSESRNSRIRETPFPRMWLTNVYFILHCYYLIQIHSHRKAHRHRKRYDLNSNRVTSTANFFLFFLLLSLSLSLSPSFFSLSSQLPIHKRLCQCCKNGNLARIGSSRMEMTAQKKLEPTCPATTALSSLNVVPAR